MASWKFPRSSTRPTSWAWRPVKIAAVGKLQDLFPCHTPSLGHHGYKWLEDVVYHGLENLSLFVGEGAGGGTHVFLWGAAG